MNSKFGQEFAYKPLAEYQAVGFPALQQVLAYHIHGALEEYADQAEIKNETLQQLIASGHDLLALNQELIREAMLNLPVVKNTVLSRSAVDVIKFKEKIGGIGGGKSSFNERIYKTILLGLATVVSGNQAVSENTLNLLKAICKEFALPEQVLEESMDYAASLFTLQQEINEFVGISNAKAEAE